MPPPEQLKGPWTPDPHALRDRVAVVAGATRGAGRGIAAALGETGATVICTGRTTRQDGSARSDYDRPETIEETAERKRWNQKSTSSRALARIYGFTDIDGSQPDSWRDLT